MTPLRPLPGDPGAVRHLAAVLRSTAERLEAIADAVGRLGVGATWDGCAGDAFSARVATVVPVLRAAAERFGGAVSPLGALATALEEAQAVVGRAVHDDDAATAGYAALEDRVWVLVSAGATEGDPAVVVLRHRQQWLVGEQERARAAHAGAMERFRVADARAAATLRALADDAIADPVLYRLMAASSSGGRDVASVGMLAPVAPELLPLGLAADGVATVAEAGLLAVYGEGDLGELAVDAGFSAGGGAGAVLRRAGMAGAEMTSAGARTMTSLTRRQRVALGVVQTARDRRDTLRAMVRGVPDRGTPSALLGGPVVTSPRSPLTGSASERARTLAREAAQRAREAARDQLRRRVLDGWQLASANGATAQRMYVSGVTLEVAAKGGAKAAEHLPPARGGGGR